MGVDGWREAGASDTSLIMIMLIFCGRRLAHPQMRFSDPVDGTAQGLES